MKTKKIISTLLSVAMSLGLFSFPVAATVNINDGSIYFKQAKNNTCTLAAMGMIFRRKAVLDKNENWYKITEATMKEQGNWPAGLAGSPKYVDINSGLNMKASSKHIYNMKANGYKRNPNPTSTISALKKELDQHPEGIVLYLFNRVSKNKTKWMHAVTLNGYDNNGNFYCADPAGSAGKGIINLMHSILTDSKRANTSSLEELLSYSVKIWYVSSSLNSETNLENTHNDYNNISSIDSQTIANDTYIISTKLNSNYVLDISNGSKDNCANLQIWENNGTSAQTFNVTHIGNGYYQITNTNSQKAIDAENGGIDAGTNVWQYEVNNTDAQIWKIIDAGNGYYHIICKKSGLYLDLNNGNVALGENIKLWTSNGGDAQKWKFIKVSSDKSTSSITLPTSGTQSTSQSTSIKFELESVPSGNLPHGKAFSLKGWFRSDSAIVEARAYILDANKNVVMQSDKASSTTSNYKIQGYKLDKAMKFNELNPGGYYLKYYVRDANGDKATWISDIFYIVK